MFSKVPFLFLVGVASMDCSQSSAIGAVLLGSVGIKEEALWVVDEVVGQVDMGFSCFLLLP